MTSWRTGPRNALTDIPGIRVGHYTDRRAATGCTVILCPEALAAAVDTRGGAPGTRETDVLALPNLVRTCHAILFAGGSAFGLAAADGVMRYCREHGIGFPTTRAPIPIVPAAVIYDLGLGESGSAPGPQEGYLAAVRARRGAVPEGTVGAGTGATVAKLLGPERALKGGLGTASIAGPRGLLVGALAVTNALGAIVDPASGALIAGPRGDDPGSFVPIPDAFERRTAAMDALLQNTTLVCIAVNAVLEPHQLQRLAVHAHDGLARAIVPVHTRGDGDVAFALAMGPLDIQPDDLLLLGAMTAAAVEQAVLRSVRHARGARGIPSAAEWSTPG